MDIKPLHIFKDEYIIKIYKLCGKSSLLTKSVLKISHATLKHRLNNYNLPKEYPQYIGPNIVVPNIKTLEEKEREYILKVFSFFEYQGKPTWRALQITDGTLIRKLDQYGNGPNKSARSWTHEQFIDHAEQFSSLDDWFQKDLGTLRAAQRAHVIPKIKKQVWGVGVSSIPKNPGEKEWAYTLRVYSFYEYRLKPTAEALKITFHTLRDRLVKRGMGADKDASSWTHEQFIEYAKQFSSIDDWFNKNPRTFRAAQGAHVIPKIKEQVWSLTTNS